MILAASIATPDRRGAMLAIYNGIATSAGIIAPYSIGLLVTRHHGDIAAGVAVFLGCFGAFSVVVAIAGFFALTPDRTRLEIQRKMEIVRAARA
jgi:MFS family permease